ncbi:MAG TPA: hypothetical protein VHE37_11685, partial [Nevskiaceae bacterium]|nr:hypothetical protein [Nevskiaceae bacterium]
MPALAELARGTVLWLDAHEYAARLLANDVPPWLDVAAYVAYARKAHGLLKPDVATLPLAPAIDAWLDAHAELRAQMAAKSRATYPLRVLLADEALRAHLLELARGLRAALSGPLALVAPTPCAWISRAYVQAHHASVEVGDDEIDSAAVYLADFLRGFGECGVDALLLEESEGCLGGNFSAYQSVFNVAAHYRWDAGLRLPAAGDAHLPDGCSYAIAPRPINGTLTAI